MWLQQTKTRNFYFSRWHQICFNTKIPGFCREILGLWQFGTSCNGVRQVFAGNLGFNPPEPRSWALTWCAGSPLSLSSHQPKRRIRIAKKRIVDRILVSRMTSRMEYHPLITLIQYPTGLLWDTSTGWSTEAELLPTDDRNRQLGGTQLLDVEVGYLHFLKAPVVTFFLFGDGFLSKGAPPIPRAKGRWPYSKS
jgi:hypothetical protein